MANFYKNALYAPTTTNTVTVYSCPSNSRAIIQNIQLTNESGSKNVKVLVTDYSTSTNVQIAYAAVSGPTICNLAKGPIILEESDILSMQTSNVSTVTAIVSILEINRTDENG